MMFNDKLIDQAVERRNRRSMIDALLVKMTPCDLQTRMVAPITFELMEKIMEAYYEERTKDDKCRKNDW